MANVAAREFAAGVTRAVFFNGPFIQRELCVLKIERACGGERRSIAREARRQYAIEHVHPARDHFQELRRRAESHRVTWLVRWQKWFSRFNGHLHFLLRLTHAHPANGVAVEI